MQLQEPKNRGMAATLPVVDGRHLGATPFASNSRYALTEASALSPGMCARRRLQGNCHFALNCAAGAREELLCVACGYEERRPIRWSNRRGLMKPARLALGPWGIVEEHGVGQREQNILSLRPWRAAPKRAVANDGKMRHAAPRWIPRIVRRLRRAPAIPCWEARSTCRRSTRIRWRGRNLRLPPSSG